LTRKEVIVMSKKFKVIITDAEYESHDPEKDVLSKLNVELIKFQCRTEEEVIRYCKDADALLNQYAPITRKVIENLEKAKIIVRYGVGVDNIDIKAATEKGIFVANVIYDISDVADHAFALILSLARKILLANKNVKNGKWDWKELQPIYRFNGSTLGIVGLGRIGSAIARRAKGFNMRILYYDTIRREDIEKELGIIYTDLDNLLKESDFVTLHVPLTNETRHLINEERLKLMKKNAIIINTSRGPVIDEKALYKALKNKWIAGAGLDVLEKEPPLKDNPLFQLDNVIVTPHMAWYSIDSLTEIQRKAAEEVARVLSGQLPINLVNKDVLKFIKI
jgi:D-3-phosphoglycerate dehydrogenase